MQEQLCPHCDPLPHGRVHIPEKIESLLSPIGTAFLRLLESLSDRSPGVSERLNRSFFGGSFKLLLALHILEEVEAFDDDAELINRSLVVVREARKRGIRIKSLRFLGSSTDLFSIDVYGVKKFFEGLPHLEIGHASSTDFSDKGKLKELFVKAGLPHPEGDVFRDYVSALQYVRSIIGFPVVVKPSSGSLSRHTTCNIKTERELERAIQIAKKICKEFVVEKFVRGDVHRVTLVNGEVAAACSREPPNVVGDGTHSIRELIEIKNQDPRRGRVRQKNVTLHRITVSQRTTSLLNAQNVHLDSVLSENRKIYLHDKVILAGGADIHDTTDVMHPQNHLLFKKVSALLSARVIGIDFIASDISKPYYEQECAVIEVNSLPYIDMHHYPVTGKARNVAGRILDDYLAHCS